MRKYYKYIIFVIYALISVVTLNVNAKSGYNYSHDGEPIYSSVGLSVSDDGVYTIISDAWENEDGDRLPSYLFTDPEDLFVYPEVDEFGNEEDIIYIVDSKSNNLFIFDGDLNYQKRVNEFEIKPENFTRDEILAIKTGVMKEGTGGGIDLTTSIPLENYIGEKGHTLLEFFEIGNKDYDQRDPATERFFITGNGLSGVYRSVRPKRDEKGFIIKDQYEDVLYLCDRNNNQILIVDAKTFEVVQVVTTPTDASFAGKIFSPVKLVTDGPGLMFVISAGVFEGIMQMSYNGEFSSYLGVSYVTLSFWERLQRRFMTEEQLASQRPIINTTFTSIAIDHEEFLYATSRAVNETDDSRMIKRINPSGDDVLTRNGYADPKGDLVHVRVGDDRTIINPSTFSAITVNDYGVYTVADSKTGRLFTYDDEGNLLYISAGRGNELTNLNNPVAIRYQGENILALDKARKAVLRYEPTDFAKSINKATRYHYEGNLTAASEEWKNVRNQNPNYEYAYVGIGKSLFDEERYEEAMEYFQRGYNINYYSRAYKLSRDQTIQKYFTPFVSTVLILIAVYYGYKFYNSKYKKRKLDPEGEGDDID